MRILVALPGENRARVVLDWPGCAGELENYTSAKIGFIFNEAARGALSQNRPIINGGHPQCGWQQPARAFGGDD